MTSVVMGESVQQYPTFYRTPFEDHLSVLDDPNDVFGKDGLNGRRPKKALKDSFVKIQ